MKLKLYLDAEYGNEQSIRTSIPILPFARFALRGTIDDHAYTFFREEVFEQLEAEPLFALESDIRNANAILMPVDWSTAVRSAPHIEAHYRGLAERFGLPLIVAHFADNTVDVPGDGVIVLRHSKYRSTLRPGEIICPPAVRDVSTEVDFKVLEKPAEPTVGFVGQSLRRPRTSLRGLLIPYSRYDRWASIVPLAIPHYGYRRSGHYLRERAMRILERTPGVRCDFAQRSFYGRGPGVREIRDHVALRRDFIVNLARNMYLLSVRGAGNYSFRFYEILAAGRVPLFVDTDCPLPLEDEIDYRSFCLFVDSLELNTIGRRLLSFHRSASSQQLADMQRKALETFREKLRFDVFSRRLFQETLPEIIHRGL